MKAEYAAQVQELALNRGPFRGCEPCLILQEMVVVQWNLGLF
jgi:hypothetical protein